MSKRRTPYVLVGDPSAHPAAMAWSRLHGNGRTPKAIHVLKDPRGKSHRTGVFRLENLGPAGAAVIAKRCRGEGAQLEHRIYENILPQLSIVGLRSHGIVADLDGPYSWLFLEEATGTEYSHDDVAHRALAAEFLATLHSSSQTLEDLSQLPDRGPAHYRLLLEAAQDSIAKNASNPALTEDDIGTLQTLASRFDRLSSRWGALETVCSRMPDTLVHGDFVGKNVRVHARAGQTVILAFDWEEAGRAIPAIDICKVDLDAYGKIVGRVWPSVDSETLSLLNGVGIAFRCIAAVGWAARSFTHDWVRPAMDKIRVYEFRLARVLEAAPWAT